VHALRGARPARTPPEVPPPRIAPLEGLALERIHSFEQRLCTATRGDVMDRINGVTGECFNALAQVRQLDEAALPAPDALHRKLRGFVDAMMQRAAQAGFSREDVNDIAYAIVALADEVAQGKSEALRQYWGGQQLQLQYFQENVAGEGFFTRLETLKRDPRRHEVLRVYALALLFGFQGRYRVRGGELELMNLQDELQRLLARSREHESETLSPQGEPPEVARAGRGGKAFVLYAAGGVVAAALLLVLGLRVWLGSSVSSVVERISAANLP
jgi:type VI secretion system protein ImpK